MAVVLALVVSSAAGAQDGGLPDAVYAEQAQLLLPGGNWTEAKCYPGPDGGAGCAGAWLPSARLEAVGRALATREAEARAAAAEPVPVPQGYVVAMLVGLAGGLVVGFAGGCWVATGSPVCVRR